MKKGYSCLIIVAEIYNKIQTVNISPYIHTYKKIKNYRP